MFKEKKGLIVLFICLFLTLTACESQTKAFQVFDTNGKSYSIPDVKGRWILVHYWAHWCKPCFEEAPVLNAFQKKYADRVLILGVDFDDSPLAEKKKWQQKLGFNFPILKTDPIQALGSVDIAGLPTTLVLNKQGHLVSVLSGPQTEKSLLAIIH